MNLLRRRLHDVRVRTRIALALALPILGVLVLSLWILSGYFRTASDMRNLRSIAELAPGLGDLVHALQKERGVSASFIGSGGVELAEKLPARHAETDQKRTTLASALINFNDSRLGGTLSRRIAAALETVDQIGTWRRAVAAGSMKAPEMTRLYGSAVARLIDIVEEVLVVSPRADLTRSIYAYLHLLHAKESAGLERAVGAAAFAAGRVDPASQDRLGELIDHQQMYLDEFRFFASPGQIALLDRTLDGVGAEELERMRRIAAGSQNLRSAGDVRASRWYDTTTRRIDQMKVVEDSLAAELVTLARQAEDGAWRTARMVAVLAAILLAFTVAVAGSLARGIIQPMSRMTSAMSKLAARDETVEITATDGRRGDEIGDMARAMIVFRENLLKVVQAEERQKNEQELRIAATAFESLHGIMVTDAKGIILRVNQAFTEMTGYSAEEAVGQTPSILKSDRHDAKFYSDMWQQLVATGTWYGEIWDRRKNGEVFPEWQTISAVRDLDGQTTHYVAAFSDISESKEAEDEIRILAFFDPLTRLPNRRLLLDRLQHALASSSRNRHHGALLVLDLDNFKNLNDSQGHDQGDMLLQHVAARLLECVHEGDTVARLGGDEFVLMLEDLSENPTDAAAEAEAVGEAIVEALNQDIELGTGRFHCTPSIGVTLYCGHETGVDELLQQADLAMYQAKAAGRNTLRFFQPDMQAAVTVRSTLEADLRRGLREHQFLLFYQPQVGAEGQLTGVEALVRWRHPVRGLTTPNEFIPLAEETGLILPLGQWVLETACARLAVWRKDPGKAHLSMAVNVSARQFHHPDFVDQVLATLAGSGADPQRLKLELTESLFLADVEDTILKMTTLKAAGVSFSLDDFGTGYSSLSYLKRLPLDQLKIDQSFIRDVLTDPNDAAIARTIVALAQSMGMAVIAEGVETEAQREFLASNNCSAYQGFLFGKAVQPEQIPH
jgi:diguanylate cyclase (GGDEF)-like protein/PAS domain S-box-containing protein